MATRKAAMSEYHCYECGGRIEAANAPDCFCSITCRNLRAWKAQNRIQESDLGGFEAVGRGGDESKDVVQKKG